MIVNNFNLNWGGLVSEWNQKVQSANQAREEREKWEKEHAPQKNAEFAKAVADAVYCITHINQPTLFVCDKEIMPNQFVFEQNTFTKKARFLTHQEIMKDALALGVDHVLIVEPGVKFMGVKTPPQRVREAHILVLGGSLSPICTFYPQERDPRIQDGYADSTCALVVDRHFMRKFIKLEFELFGCGMDKIYARTSRVMCMVPPPFEQTQLSPWNTFMTKTVNAYRSFTTYNLDVLMRMLILIFVVLLLVVLLML